MVTHVPMSYSGEPINGELPMLSNDMYFVVGCPFTFGDSMSSSLGVLWISGPVRKLISGIPVTNASGGICESPAIIAAFQTIVTD